MMVTIDPTKSFKKAKQGALLDACGLIPLFAVEAFMQGHETTEAMFKAMTKTYGFGSYPMDGGTVDPETGVYSYPEDPDLAPLVKLELPENPVTVYVYQHAILSLVADGQETIVCRMD
jgi:hypothetical protein